MRALQGRRAPESSPVIVYLMPPGLWGGGRSARRGARARPRTPRDAPLMSAMLARSSEHSASGLMVRSGRPAAASCYSPQPLCCVLKSAATEREQESKKAKFCLSVGERRRSALPSPGKGGGKAGTPPRTRQTRPLPRPGSLVSGPSGLFLSYLSHTRSGQTPPACLSSRPQPLSPPGTKRPRGAGTPSVTRSKAVPAIHREMTTKTRPREFRFSLGDFIPKTKFS